MAKLRLEAKIKIIQYKLLPTLIKFGEESFSELISYIKGVTFTEEEIKVLLFTLSTEQKYINIKVY